MEQVRRGRGLRPEHEELMQKNGVPHWYIESCKKICYLFPKAHAVAYTISSLRIAWFKVYHAVAYYCAYFTIRADEFDSHLMCQPAHQIRRSRQKLHDGFREATDREQRIYYILEVVEEMQLRGISFLPIDLLESGSTRFLVAGQAQIRSIFQFRRLTIDLSFLEGLNYSKGCREKNILFFHRSLPVISLQR
jgi:DNA polymerase-3 subunit alpha (Gram-positive type)